MIDENRKDAQATTADSFNSFAPPFLFVSVMVVLIIIATFAVPMAEEHLLGVVQGPPDCGPARMK